MRTYNLCLLGFGNVGRALARLFQDKSTELHDKYDIQWQITGVATRRRGWIADANGLDISKLLAHETDLQSIPFAQSNVHQWLMAAKADVLFEVSSLNVQT